MENKTAGHTPGPWRAIHSGAGDATVEAQPGWTYKNGAEHRPTIANRVTWENAFLIAAAPELLEECKKNLWWLQHVRSQIQGPKNVMLGFDQAIKYLGIVIAKAGGR